MEKGPASAGKKRDFPKIFLILMTSALLLMLASAGILSTKPTKAVAQQATPALQDKVGAHLIWLSRENEAKMDEVLTTMANAGVKWLRTDFSWADLEPTYDPAKGHVFDWDAHDRMVNLANAKGINILGILSSTPDWASSQGDPPEYIIDIFGIRVAIPKSAYPPSDPSWWSNYVNEVVSHFDGRVETWEIWNEPNLTFFKKYGYADNADEEKADYMNLVQLAYTAINGRGKLALGALAGFGADGGGPGDPNAYLRKCLDLGAANYADIISFHPYPQNLNLDNNSHPHEAGMKQRLQEMRTLIDSYHPGRTIELWITEVGWTNSNDPWPATPYGVDEDTQAAYTLRMYLSYLDDSDYTATNLKLTKIFYYNLWDQCFKECTAFKTTDNGSTWVREPTRAHMGTWLDNVNGLNGVDTFDGTNVWAVGNHGSVTVLGSADAGENFWYQNSNEVNYLQGVSAASASTAYAVGGDGMILKTTGGGGPYVQWTSQTSGTTNFLNGVSAVDTNNVFAVGDNGTILNTTTGGNSWSPQTSSTTADLNSVSAFKTVSSVIVAWAVGQNGTILYTNNGGASWSIQAGGLTTNNLKSVSAVNESVCWAVGANGAIFKTSDGGSTWLQEASGTTKSLNSVSALDADNAWAVGEDATVLRKSAGTAWESKPTHASMRRLSGVVATNSTTAMIVGYKDPWLDNPDGLGIHPPSINNYGLLNYLVQPKKAFNYLQRLTGTGTAGALFNNATAVLAEPLISNIVTNPTGASATLQKHVFQMPDGSLLVSFWNSDAASPQDPNAALGFTLTDASGSSTIYDNPLQVNLENGATGPLDSSVIVGVDANSNIAVANLTIGKTPVILKYAKKAAPCGSGSGATVMLLGLMMGLMSLASGGALRWRLRRRSS